MENNPWWEDELCEDEDLMNWELSRVKWVPELMEKIQLKPFALHFLFGSRQVGKTTLVKLLVRKLLEKGVEPKSVFYFRCDKLSDFKELDKVLSFYLKLRSLEKIDQSSIFLDEITFPKEWFRTIKYLIDVGKLKNDVLLLTGSLSMVARGEVEYFPVEGGTERTFSFTPFLSGNLSR